MAYEITTSRLSLRPVAAEDLEELHRLWTDPEVRKYIWDGVAMTREEAAQLIDLSIHYFGKLRHGLWSMTPIGEAGIVGFCGFWYFRDPPEPELIYGLLPAYWGRGLATEAASAMIQYGFDQLSFDSIVGSTDAANAESTRVMERAGMTLIKRATVAGLDTIYYEITREQFDQLKRNHSAL